MAKWEEQIQIAWDGLPEHVQGMPGYGPHAYRSPYPNSMSVTEGFTRTWSVDTITEFLSLVRNEDARKSLYMSGSAQSSLTVSASGVDRCEVSVAMPSREIVLAVMSVFEEAADLYANKRPLPEPEIDETSYPGVGIEVEKPLRVFIGHGGASRDWQDLKDHLTDLHGVEVETYETGTRAGHAIRDILADMLSVSTMAFLVHTKEDETNSPDRWRARQNVVHETGLFQGRLGFDKAIVIEEAGVEHYSNLDGIQYIRYEHSIKETYGYVLATIQRERNK